MPAPHTTEELLDLIRRSNMIAPKRLDEYLASLDATDSQLHEPKRMATRLVRDGLLTYFQAEQLMQGKWRGFTLGKYRILEKLGSGGMGSVFLCEHMVMNHRVAVKVLPLAKAKDPSALARFYREARAAAGVDHPNIVRAFDIDQEGDRHFLVMEYVDGTSLQDLVKRRGPLEVVRAAHYIRQAAYGLQHAHEAGLVHRDIKPGNLLVDRAGLVKVADLGLARFFHDDKDDLTREYDEGAILGSADYFAPEQALNSHEVDIRADIYALGCTLYFLLTGRPPFQEGTVTQKLLWHQLKAPPPIRDQRPEVPAALAGVLERMMAKKAEDRFQQPELVAHALGPWTDSPIPAPAEADFRRLSRAAQGSGAVDTRTGPGSGRTHISYPPIPETPPVKPPESAKAEPFAWDQLDSAISYEASPAGSSASGQHDSSSRRLSESFSAVEDAPPPHRRRTLVFAGGVVLAAVAAAGLWWGLTRPTRSDSTGPANNSVANDQDKGTTPTPPTARSDIRLVKAESGKEVAYENIWTALGKAVPGDRILVQADTVEELLVLRGDGKLGRDVTIEGRTLTGQPVMWRPASGHGKDQPLIALGNTPGLRLTGFILDGAGRVNDLLVLSERCPGLTLDNVQCRGFLRSAVKLHNGEGEPARPITVVNLVTAVEQEAEAAVYFEATSGKVNQHVEVLDSRFLGRYRSTVRVAGPLAFTTFTRNRFFKGATAFRFHKGATQPRLHLGLFSNTFSDFDTGLHWEAVPPNGPGNQVVVRDNLFLKTKTLATTDGITTQPEKPPAQWIWFDEPSAVKEAVPAESRFFRKKFTVSKGVVTRATLDIAGDDSFIVWLNGVQVARSPFGHYTRHVYSFDLSGLLKAGSNLLAVQGTNRADFMTNKPTGARLLVQLTYTIQGKSQTVAVSDSSWKAARTAPQNWNRTGFNDDAWKPAKVLGPYEAEGISQPYANLTWDSEALWLQPALGWQRVFATSGNVRDGGREGYPTLEARFGEFRLPADPASETDFLLYPPESPLAAAGTEHGPVGVPPPPPALAPATIILISREGKEQVCRSVRDALLQAKAGERVVVRGDVLEEPLTLWGKDGFVGNVTLEGQPTAGKAVLWRVPLDQPGNLPLLRFTDLSGLMIRGFILDGRERVDDLVVLAGYCPAVVLEDLHLRGFRRTGLVLRDCTGLQDRPVTIQRLRTTTRLSSDTAVALEADPGHVNRFLRIYDCRFEGPYQSALRLAAPVADLDLQRNRIHRAVNGLLYPKAAARRQIHLTMQANTFLDVNRVWHFEALPAPDQNNQLLLRNNLFARVQKLVQVDGVEFEPRITPAKWVWFPESGDLLKTAPPGTRFFRKTFDLPKDKLTAAVLNITCDDSFSVWLNGKEIGKGRFTVNSRVVAAFDVVKHLRPGQNVLAVEGRNERGVAGLLVQLTVRASDNNDRLTPSDETWLTSKEGPTGWQEPGFVDKDWKPAYVVANYAQSPTNWRFLLWQSLVASQNSKFLWPLFSPASAGNASCRNAGVTTGYCVLEVTNAGQPTSLGLDPDHDATYLRYSRENPLAQAGVEKGPVGVPPVE